MNTYMQKNLIRGLFTSSLVSNCFPLRDFIKRDRIRLAPDRGCKADEQCASKQEWQWHIGHTHPPVFCIFLHFSSSTTSCLFLTISKDVGSAHLVEIGWATHPKFLLPLSPFNLQDLDLTNDILMMLALNICLVCPITIR